MYVLSPNSLGVRQTAIIVGEFQHVRTFTELIQHHRDGNNRRKFQHVHTFTELTQRQRDGTNRQEFKTCTYFHRTHSASE